MKPIDNVRRDFRDGLIKKASKKKRQASVAAKRKPEKTGHKVIADASVPAKLNEILGILKKKAPDSKVKFSVTERDANGKVKAFEVS